MLGAFLFCRADCESALGSSAPEPDSSGGMVMIAPILKRTLANRSEQAQKSYATIHVP